MIFLTLLIGTLAHVNADPVALTATIGRQTSGLVRDVRLLTPEDEIGARLVRHFSLCGINAQTVGKPSCLDNYFEWTGVFEGRTIDGGYHEFAQIQHTPSSRAFVLMLNYKNDGTAASLTPYSAAVLRQDSLEQAPSDATTAVALLKLEPKPFDVALSAMGSAQNLRELYKYASRLGHLSGTPREQAFSVLQEKLPLMQPDPLPLDAADLRILRIYQSAFLKLVNGCFSNDPVCSAFMFSFIPLAHSLLATEDATLNLDAALFFSRCGLNALGCHNDGGEGIDDSLVRTVLIKNLIDDTNTTDRRKEALFALFGIATSDEEHRVVIQMMGDMASPGLRFEAAKLVQHLTLNDNHLPAIKILLESTLPDVRRAAVALCLRLNSAAARALLQLPQPR